MSARPRTNGEYPSDALYCLTYVSTQRLPLDHAALVTLLAHARGKNEILGVTGLLLHRADSFFQILEGARETVLQLFAAIKNDPRHERVEVVSEGGIDSRQFADWRMAFVDLEGQDVQALPGFSDILSNRESARDLMRGLPRSRKLALLFALME